MIQTDTLCVTRMPRTGSTWCIEYLKPVAGYRPIGSWLVIDRRPGKAFAVCNHSAWCDISRNYPHKRDGIKAYVQVRNPHDWLASVYAYLYSNAPDEKDRNFLLPIPPAPRLPGPISGDDHFDRWVKLVLTDPWVTQMYLKYTDTVDYVGATEHCRDDLTRALLDSGCDPNTPFVDVDRQNPSKRLPMWDIDLYDLMYKEHPKPFEVWNRAFDGNLCKQGVLK